MAAPDAGKAAEVAYPERVGEDGREWIAAKPFGLPGETPRLLHDLAYVVDALDLRPGHRLLELGCGSGWISRLVSRHGVACTGYDIAPGMIAIARERAAVEGADCRFEVGDIEEVDAGHGAFDRCLVYDALHHVPRADRVLAVARKALVPGGVLLVVEPNWNHRFGGRAAARRWGVRELGRSAGHQRRLVTGAGFVDVERLHVSGSRVWPPGPRAALRHAVDPVARRVLGGVATRVWLRARAPD